MKFIIVSLLYVYKYSVLLLNFIDFKVVFLFLKRNRIFN